MRMRVPISTPTDRPSVGQHAPSRTAPAGLPASVEQTLRNPGEPLDRGVRAMMEPRFGSDFGRVRVFRGAQAEQSADAVHAQAYTVGPNVVFGPGQYAPATTAGRHLIAHELAHVVQQSDHPGPPLQRQPKPTPAPDPAAIDPKNLGTLGPAFEKSEADVDKLGLKKKPLLDQSADPTFQLFWAQNSTVPLRSLVPGTSVYLIGRVLGEKSLVWAHVEGETDMVEGYVKTAFLEDPWVTDWVKRQPSWGSLKAPDLTPPNARVPDPSPPPYKSSWDVAFDPPASSEPTPAPAPGPNRVDWPKFRKIISEALARNKNVAWDAFSEVYARRNGRVHLANEPDPCLDPTLAAADHYLFARSLVMDFHYPAFFVKMMNAAYAPFKNAVMKKGFDPALGECPTSPGTIEQQLAGDMGADSGSDLEHPENITYDAFGAKSPPQPSRR
jgi:hypothetical protein